MKGPGPAGPAGSRSYTVRLDPVEAAQIEALARERGISPDTLIAQLAGEQIEQVIRRCTGTDRPADRPGRAN